MALAAALGTAAAGQITAPPRLELNAGAVTGPNFSVTALRIAVDLANPGRGEALLRNLQVAGRPLGDVRLTCADLRLSQTRAACHDGRLGATPAQWRYDAARGEGWLRLVPAPAERWELRVGASAAGTRAELTIDGGRLERVRNWLPTEWLVPSAGTVSGSAAFRPGVAGAARLEAKLRVDALAFADASGLRAGEGIGGALALSAERSGAEWNWDASLDWGQGAVFWDPLYAPGGVKATASGQVAGGRVRVQRLRTSLPGAVAAAGAVTWDLEAGRASALELEAETPDLEAAFGQWVAPLLTGGRWAGLKVAGAARVQVSMVDGKLRAAALALERGAIDDPGAAMTLTGGDAQLRWRADGPGSGRIAWAGGSVYGVPIGAAAVALDVVPDGLGFREAMVPLLDGTLSLQDARFRRSPTGWSWELRGGLSAVSMEKLTQHLGWPAMRGTLSGVVPRVAYRDRVLDVDGALLFRVFDGTAVARGLHLEDPLGRAPRLTAEVEMRALDLDLVTRALSFGSMEGRIDVDVRGLELVNWTPVRFDARIASAPGDYPRTISQRAVENISALGGAGAAAAIRRSFLRVFERFRYRRLGLSCELRDGVCRMDGVAPAPQGYVIVEGGGVPAVTVIGYNRAVGWNELIGRLKRITEANVTPVVQ
ncbi:MAG: hypothetical protein ACOZDY_09660 [Pseudomonadota bacterium]